MRILNPNSWPFKIADLPYGCALVGGSVRDGLLDRLKEKPDLDFIVKENAIELIKNIARQIGGSVVILDERRDIGRLVFKGSTFDFSSQIGEDLVDDLLHRDFTINAIAVTLEEKPKLLDPTGGIKDLKLNLIRAISEQNLILDPLRMLRGIRFISQLNFGIDKETKMAIKRNSVLLTKAASERIKSEIIKIVESESLTDLIPVLYETGLLSPWQEKDKFCKKEFPSFFDSSFWEANELSIAIPLVRLSKLLSNQGMVQLGFSRKYIRSHRLLKIWQNRNDGLAFQSLNEEDLMQLHLDMETILPALVVDLPVEDQKEWLRRWRDLKDPLFHPSSPVDGFTLQKEIGIPSGPLLGQLMLFLQQEKAFGRLNTLDDALSSAYLWKNTINPSCD